MSELDKITYLQQHKPTRIVGVLILNSKHKYGKKIEKIEDLLIIIYLDHLIIIFHLLK